MNKLKLTPAERSWVLYDVGNSAFTLLIATIIPIYFNFLAEEAGLSNVQYLAYWGYAASAGRCSVPSPIPRATKSPSSCCFWAWD